VSDVVLAVVLLLAAGGGAWLLADLRTVPRGAPDAGRSPSASVVIPARNEEATLPGLLASLRALPLVEIVVVDDSSVDATAAVARSGGATALPASPPPPGWTGKAWACQLGAGAARGDLLLFLDADTVLEPDALAGLLELHERHGGLVSVQPYHRVEHTYEQLSSYFNVMSLMAVGAGLAVVEAATGWGASFTYGAPLLWAAAWVAVAVQLAWILRRIGSFRWWTWALFPVCLVAFDLIFARSALHTVLRRSVQWRGRDVALRASSEEVL